MSNISHYFDPLQMRCLLAHLMNIKFYFKFYASKQRSVSIQFQWNQTSSCVSDQVWVSRHIHLYIASITVKSQLSQLFPSVFDFRSGSDLKFDSTNRVKSGHRVFFTAGFRFQPLHNTSFAGSFSTLTYLCLRSRRVELHCTMPHDLLGLFRLLPYFC